MSKKAALLLAGAFAAFTGVASTAQAQTIPPPRISYVRTCQKGGCGPNALRMDLSSPDCFPVYLVGENLQTRETNGFNYDQHVYVYARVKGDRDFGRVRAIGGGATSQRLNCTASRFEREEMGYVSLVDSVRDRPDGTVVEFFIQVRGVRSNIAELRINGDELPGIRSVSANVQATHPAPSMARTASAPAR